MQRTKGTCVNLNQMGCEFNGRVWKKNAIIVFVALYVGPQLKSAAGGCEFQNEEDGVIGTTPKKGIQK